MMAATAANIAPPATPRSVINNICASLFAVVLELPPREQLGQEVPVAVFVPAGTPVAYTSQLQLSHRRKVGLGTFGPSPWLEGPL